MALALPPVANDVTVNVVIPKKVVPYFQEWYNRQKKASETAAQFAYRVLKEVAIRERLHFYTSDANLQLQADLAVIQADIELP